MEGPRYSCDGLPTGDVIVSEIREEVSESTVCRYFGPKSSKSGWKYCALTTEAEQDGILSLYRRVYEAEEIPNKEITLSFAKGLILMSLGRAVNWAQFAGERKKVREALKKKAENRKEKRERESDDDHVSAPSILGKRRFCAEKDRSGFPNSLALTVKSEGGLERVSMGKKQLNRSGRDVVSGPSWEGGEVESMVRVIECRLELLEDCRAKFVGSSEELVATEDKLRREKLLLGDRQLMLDRSKLRLTPITAEESALRVTVEEKSVLLARLESELDNSSSSVRAEIAALNARADALRFKIGLEEITISRSEEAIAECKDTIAALLDILKEASASHDEYKNRVVSVESIVVLMKEQLHRMQAGEGAAFFPRPVEGSPASPLEVTHILNACPVCSLWFESFDYSSLACGHTYHPYCLWEHAQKSSKCLVPLCKRQFDSQHSAAVGIRPTWTTVNGVKTVCSGTRVAAPVKTDHSTSETTILTSSWEKESSEKLTPLSQSSQTNPASTALSSEKETPTSTCALCQKKPATVFVEACGHDVFCFGCIEGLKVCPICNGAITGWGRLNKRQRLSPYIKSAPPTPNDFAEPPITAAMPNMEEIPVFLVKDSAEQGEKLADSDSNEESSYSSDREDQTIQWADDDAFSNGAARSILQCSDFTVALDDVDVTTRTSPLSAPTKSKKFAVVSQLVDTGSNVVQPCATVKVRSKAGRPSKTYLEGQKFKSIVEKAAKILGPIPGAGAAERAAADSGTIAESGVLTKKRSSGRPPSVGKSRVPVEPREVSSSKPGAAIGKQSRIALRRRDPHDSVPVKFRGMN